jgi:hypothetical protein
MQLRRGALFQYRYGLIAQLRHHHFDRRWHFVRGTVGIDGEWTSIERRIVGAAGDGGEYGRSGRKGRASILQIERDLLDRGPPDDVMLRRSTRTRATGTGRWRRRSGSRRRSGRGTLREQPEKVRDYSVKLRPHLRD